jgi:hypothetical protein
LTVNWQGGEFKTREFVIRRGDNEELRVTYEPESVNRVRPSSERFPPKEIGTVDTVDATTVSPPRKLQTRSAIGKESQVGGQSPFVQLFNGRDMTGWKTHPSRPGNWRVENGVLIGSGQAVGDLYSERGDYGDFHLRVEARFNNVANSGIHFRLPYGGHWNQAYGVQIGVANNGELCVTDWGTPRLAESNVSAFQWFTLDLIADGNHIIVKVGETITADYIDVNHRFDVGHIAFELPNPETLIEFRKIELREFFAASRELHGAEQRRVSEGKVGIRADDSERSNRTFGIPQKSGRHRPLKLLNDPETGSVLPCCGGLYGSCDLFPYRRGRRHVPDVRLRKGRASGPYF